MTALATFSVRRTMRIRSALLASLAVFAVGAQSAGAAGTPAGVVVTNSVTADYQVNGISQPQRTASASFTVDRKVNLVIAETGTPATTTVTPNQTGAVAAFTLTNASNDTLDFSLVIAQPSGGAGIHDIGASDVFDVAGARIYVDADSSGTVTAGDSDITATPFLDEVLPDDNVRLLVVADVPSLRAAGGNLATGDVAAVTLTATARSGGGAGTQGAVLVATTAADTPNQIDTVFADSSAGGNIAGDGMAFASDDYTVLTAGLTVLKTSRIVSDPINLTTNPKAIPGATVEYCISVANGSGQATATALAISDTVPATLAQAGAIDVRGPVAAPGDPCAASISAQGALTGSVVTAALPDLAADHAAAVVFQAIIN